MADQNLEDQKAFEQELRELGDAHPGRKPDEIFTAWFVRAYVAEDFDEGFESLTGAARDKNVDAIYIDDKRQVVVVVQAKARKRLRGGNETRSDVITFAGVSKPLLAADDDEALAAYLTDMNEIARVKFFEAREKVDEGYRPQLVYVTPYRVSSGIEHDARMATDAALDPTGFEIIDGTPLARLLHDYRDGVAPPVPRLELPVGDLGMLEHKEGSVSTWVVGMSGFDVGQLFAQAGKRLFARNIRGFLADTKINQSMIDTIKKDPGGFFYRNNGVTVVCDRAQATGGRTDAKLMVSNPQIINGQQTTRSLHAAGGKAKSTTVLVRVIEIERSGDGRSQEQYNDLVSDIVKATNWQNPISPADLRSNDPIQIELERELRKRGYQYQRKKEGKSELAARSGSHLPRERRFTKEALSTAIGNCIFPSFTARVGIDKRFDEDNGYYEKIFPHRDVEFFLGCWWLYQRVRRTTWGVPIWKDAKWHALYLTWQVLGQVRTKKVFVSALEVDDDRVRKAVDAVIEHHLAELESHYKRNRGRRGEELDAATFFKSHLNPKDIPTERTSAKQAALDKKTTKVEAALKRFAME